MSRSVRMDAETLVTQCSVYGGSSAGAYTYRRSFSSPKTSTWALGPTHPPLQGVKGVFGGKAAVTGVDHSRPPSVDVKNEWSFTSTPPYTFTTCLGTTLPFYGDQVRHFIVPNQLHDYLKVHDEHSDVSLLFALARQFNILKSVYNNTLCSVTQDVIYINSAVTVKSQRRFTQPCAV
jgi:hypothetical protein